MGDENPLPGFALTLRAAAKINLALHVRGQRADGYHLIDSLVTFADAGDRIGISPAKSDQFTLSGRFSTQVPDGAGGGHDNLVLKARDGLRQMLDAQGKTAGPVHIHLEKNLPVASGIGGGSADAAATLKGLDRLWEARLAASELNAIGLMLGADLPMCLTAQPLVARGIGEEIMPVSPFPAFPVVLVNPLVHVPTPEIFRALASKNNPPIDMPASPMDATGWLHALRGMRNDLELPARRKAPQIAEAAALLAEAGARLVRMSGSGATCFGIFASLEEADAAAKELSGARPDWYVAASQTAGSLTP